MQLPMIGGYPSLWDASWPSLGMRLGAQVAEMFPRDAYLEGVASESTFLNPIRELYQESEIFRDHCEWEHPWGNPPF